LVSHYRGEHVAVGTNATRRAQWSSATLWDGNPGHEMRELSDLNSQIRFLKIGTDSVALAIVDADSTYLYKRLATTSTAPEVWNRSSWAGNFDTLLYASYSNGALTHIYPNSSGWTVVAGELVKAESTLTFPSITLYGRPEADFKGNLWTYGYKIGTTTDTVLVKFERLTGRGIYYSASRGAARFLERDLAANITSSLIGHNGRIDSVYIGSSPYIAERTVEFSVVTSQMSALMPVTISDDVQTTLYSTFNLNFWGQSVPDFLADSAGSRTFHNGTNYAVVSNVRYPTGAQYISSRLRKYDWQPMGVQNSRDTSKVMADTIMTNWTILSDSMRVVSPVDTTIYDTTNYSRTIIVTNSMRPRIKSMKKPAWLTIQDAGEDTSVIFDPYPETDSAPEYQKSLHFFTISGQPGTGHTTGEVDTVTIVFIDSLPTAQTFSLPARSLPSYFQTCTLSYRITLTSTGTEVQQMTPRVIVVKKTSNVRTFDLLGRPMNSQMKASAILIQRTIGSRATKTTYLPR
jgi:hypothetical protein